MKHCPKCKKNRVSIGRELCDSCHRYETHSEGIEKQWGKVAQSRRTNAAEEKALERMTGSRAPKPQETPWRILFALFVIGYTLWHTLSVLLSLPAGVGAAYVLWEAGTPFAVGLLCALYLLVSGTEK